MARRGQLGPVTQIYNNLFASDGFVVRTKTSYDLPRYLASSFALGLSLVAVACGPTDKAVSSAGSAAVETKEEVVGGAKNLADKAEDWVNADPLTQRREMCDDEAGQWLEDVTVSACTDGRMTVTADGNEMVQECNSGEGGHSVKQCGHRDASGNLYFNDGPSVPHLLQKLSGSVADRSDLLRYNRLFWPAGVNHDYCYHHGEMVRGLSRSDCDRQYYSDVSAVCAYDQYAEQYDWFRPDTCRNIAASQYTVVRLQGSGPFAALNSNVAYPQWSPLWQQFGLSHDPIDERVVDEVNDKLGRTNLLGDD